jgi:putative DNA primase/helicase
VPVDAGIPRTLLEGLGLPPDYPWAMRSGSGAGWHIYIRCEASLPPGILTEKAGEKGVFTGKPLNPGEFDHIELRWHGVQSVPAFASVGDVPDEPPALVGAEDVVRAFLAVAPAAPPPPPPPANYQQDTVDQVKARLDLVEVAGRLFGASQQEGNEVRFPNNGGLLVNADKQQWYCHQTEQGGDVLDLLCYHQFGSTLNGDKERFKQVLQEAAAMAGVELPPARASALPLRRAPARVGHVAVAPLPLLPVDLPSEALASLAEDLDKGDSELLAFLYPHELRYDHRRSGWFLWNGTHWELDRGGAKLRGILSTQVRSQYQRALVPLSAELGVLQAKEKRDDADNERMEKLERWCGALGKRIKTLATAGGCRNVATFAQSYLSFDGAWNTEHAYLPCRNGYVDLRTGERHPPDPAMAFNRIIDIEYNPNATAPKWDAFLQKMQPDPEMREYLQTYAGYAATGIAEEVCAFFIGNGANGKTTFCNVLFGVLGDFCSELSAETLLEQRGRHQNFDIAAVEAARLVVARELPPGTLSASTLKRLVDIGKLHIERKYEQPYDIERTHSLVIYANDTPRIKDTSDGTWRRLHLVEWQQSVPEDQRVENYHRRILADEAQGVLAWIVQGARKYLASGLKKPAGVRQATESYRAAEDDVALFIAQCCVLGPDLYTPAQELFDAYREFEYGNKSQRVFRKEMTRRLGETHQRRVGTRNIRCYGGIGLLEEPHPDPEDEGSRTCSTSATHPEAGFGALESENPDTHYGNVALVALATQKVQNKPTREGCIGEFTDLSATSATTPDENGGIPLSEAPNRSVALRSGSATHTHTTAVGATTEIAAGRYGWSIHRVGGHFEARQLLAKDKPETRHAGTLAAAADYANERGAGILQVCSEERGGYRLEYRPAPRGTWRVVDSEGRNVTGYEYPNEEQARDVLAARNSRND